ncbi:MAG: hypothetical protein N2C14_19865, partial [Planctomycetales bacterium]
MSDSGSSEDLQATMIHPSRKSPSENRSQSEGKSTTAAGVQFVHGKRPRFEEETRDLLRKRLLHFSLLFCFVSTYAMIESLVGAPVPYLPLRAMVMVIAFGVAGLCWSGVPLSLRQLRVIELVMWGSLAVMVLGVMAGYLIYFADRNNPEGVLSVKYAHIG